MVDELPDHNKLIVCPKCQQLCLPDEMRDGLCPDCTGEAPKEDINLTLKGDSE